MTAFLDISDIGIRFHPAAPAVLVDVNLPIAQGEYVSIIGHSGCGKSTLLNIVAGLLKATDGGVILDGREVDTPGPDRAVVFQNHSLLPWLTCRENILLAVDQVFAGVKSRAERLAWVDENLALVRMLPHAHKRPGEISGGMKQRIGIARALAMQPKVLLLDEPFGALDALTRAHLQDQVMEIHARLGTTVLMITHDVDEAVLLSDRIVMMTNGPEATIGEILSVPLPRPRDRLTLVNDPVFIAARAAVMGFLYRPAPQSGRGRVMAPSFPCGPALNRIVVVGAGPAGMRCAERLGGRGLAVTLIGAEAELPYNRVALSRFLAGEIAAPELITHDAATLAAAGITYLPGTLVTFIDREARRVLTDRHSPIGYGHLVLALGSQPVRLPFPGADLPGVVTYRTLDDVNAMLEAAEAGGDAIVIGGGLLGLEAAYGLAKRGMKVSVLHAVDRLMERQLDHAAAALLMRRMAEYRIDTYLTARTEAIEGDGRVQAVRLADGTMISASLVVMAVGIRPQAALAREAGLAVNRGIVVDDAMRTSDPAIFAIGECAEHQGACCGLVAPALAQAETCARVIAGATIAYAAEAEATALKVAGAGVWSAGRIDAEDAEEIILSDAEGGEYRKLLLHEDRLVGAVLYGETADAPWYQSLIANGTPMDGLRAALPFGPAFAPRSAAPALGD